jgi:acyl-CoA thioesterase-1
MTAATPIKTVFFGDSICFGQGVSLHKGWVTRIAAQLSEMSEESGRELLVVNASINGNTTRQALERMPYDVQSNGVDVLIVQFGLNDCNYWQSDRGHPRVSPAAFEANLEEIASRAITFGANKILLNTNHPTARGDAQMPFTDLTYEASNRRYNELIRDAAARLDSEVIILNDLERAFLDAIDGSDARRSELVLADGLHLSEAGHDLYFDVVYPVLERVVADLLGSSR